MATTTRAKPAAAPHTRYEDDLYTWVGEQVALLRAGRFDEVDAENVAEELGDVGKSELRTLESAIAVLTMHLLKWDFQPRRRSVSWEATIEEQRRQVRKTLKENPGLKHKLRDAMAEGYASGRNRAVIETKLPYATFPQDCPFDFEEMMSRPIVSEPPPRQRRKKR